MKKEEETPKDLIKKIEQLESRLKVLEKLNSLYKGVFENLPFGIQVFDENGFSFLINEKQKDLLGLPDINEGIGKFNVLNGSFAKASGADKFFKKAYNGEKTEHEFLYNLGVSENKFNTRKDTISFKENIFPLIENGKVKYVVAALSDASDKKKAEYELRESEAKYRLLVKNSSDVIVILNEKSEEIYISESVERVTGYKVNELLGKKMEEVIHPDDLPFILAVWQKSLEQPDLVQTAQYRHIHKTKGWIYLEAVGQNHLNDPLINGIVLSVRDISERKKAEEKISRLANMVDIAPNAILIHDFEGKIKFSNQRNLELHGYTHEEFFKLSLKDIDVPESAELIKQRMDMIRKQGEATFEVEHKKKDGTIFPLLLFVKLVEWDGKPAMLSIGTDISIRKKALSDLLKSDKRIKSIFRAAPIGIGVVKERVITEVNPQILEMTGYSKEELIGQSARILYSTDEEFEWVGNEKYRQIGLYGSGTVETHWKRKDGTILDILLSSTPINHMDLSEGVTFTALDITERKKTEKVLTTRLHINEFAQNHTIDELLIETLDVLEPITESTIGFYHFYDEDTKQITLQKWSTRTLKEYCSVDEAMNRHYSLDKAGVWVDCIRERKAVIHNNYKSLKNKKGFPEGHVQIIRELVVPVFRNNKIVAVFGVGNKPYDYNRQDVELISQIGDIVFDIIERKVAEEKVQKLSKGIENSPAVVVFTDGEGTIEYVNPKFTEITGYSLTEALGKNPRILKSGNQDEAFYKHMWETITRGENWKGEMLNKKKNGELYWESALISPVFNEKKEITNFIAIKEDITERKLLQKELVDAKERAERSEAQFKNLFEKHEAIMLIIEPVSGLIMDANNAAVKFYGYSKEELCKKHIQDINTLTKKQVKRERKKALNEKRNYFVFKHILSSGEEKVVEVHSTPIEYLGQKVLFSIIHDITERKIQEKELIEAKERAEHSEERYQAFIQQSSEGIYRLEMEKPMDVNMDVESQIDFMYDNAYLAEFSGRFAEMYNAKSVDELLGKKIIELHGGRHNPINRQEMREFIEGGYRIMDKVTEEHTLTNDVIYLSNSSVGIIENGKLVRTWGIQKDITEQYRLHEELILAKEKAEESDRLKTAFLANMSHEIRTPMNSILGFTQLLKENRFPQEKQSKFLDIISLRSKDLLRIINDIIDISKIEANQLIIDETEFSLNNLLMQTYNQFKADLQTDFKKDIKLNLSLGLKGKRSIIKSDESRLKQVLVNLLHNAVKFTNKGEINFGYTVNENHLEFYVKDTGIGIADEYKEVIFERFRQADDSSTRKYGGTGLGLPICKQILRLMDGDIWVQSDSEKGSTFYFSIPLKRSEKFIEEIPEDAVLQNHEENIWKDKKILVVEDDVVSSLYFSEVLEPTQINIINCVSGLDVFRILSENKDIAIVLLDINLPGVNGNEIVKKIKKKYPKLPVVAQSAFSMKNEIDASLKAGFDEYLTKPIDAKVLISTLKKFFKK